MEKYRNIISKANYVAFLALLASLPFPQPFIHFCWMVWIVTWLLEFRYLHKENIQIDKRILYISCGVVVWLLWNILSVFWAENTEAVWNTVVRYVSLLTIPLAGIFGVNKHYNWYRCIRVLLLSCGVSLGVYMFTHYWVVNSSMAFNKHAAATAIDWWHMDNLLLCIKHRMHYANLLCMLIPCLFIAHAKTRKLPIITGCILIMMAIYMTGSRVALIYLVVLATITLCWFILRQRKTWVKSVGIGAAVLVIVVGSFAGMMLHPRNAGHSVTELIRVDTENMNTPAFEPRFAIWHTALEQPEDYIMCGLGAGNATDYLVKRYEELGWKGFAERQFSPHNQYLSVCMDLGVIAAVLFALFWILLPLWFRAAQRYWVLCLTGICMCSMMTDVLFGGLEGIVFISVMAVLGMLMPNTYESNQLPQAS